MGYRSTVAFVISFKDKETLDNYLAPRLLDENLKDYRENFSRISWDDASVLYHTEDIKWYDTYPVVQALTKLLLSCTKMQLMREVRIDSFE